MTNDVVQFGSFVVSKIVFDFLIVIISIITGGLITYATTRTIENQRWKQQKKDKLLDAYREALSLALDWIGPLDNALIRIESLSSALIWKRVTRDEFEQRWPNLLNNLSNIDRNIPPRLKILLPSDAYDGLQIVHQIDDLYTYLLASKPPGENSENDLFERLNKAGARIVEIRKLTDDYKKMLIEEYKNSYK